MRIRPLPVVSRKRDTSLLILMPTYELPVKAFAAVKSTTGTLAPFLTRVWWYGLVC